MSTCVREGPRRVTRATQVAACVLVSVAALAAPGRAGWGPSPVRVLAGGAETALAPVEGDFERELERLLPDAPATPFRPDLVGVDTVTADVLDLEAAMRRNGVGDAGRLAAIDAYKPLRWAAASFTERLDQWTFRTECQKRNARCGEPGPRPTLPSRYPVAALPAAIPAEFRTYARGALLFARGDLPAARDEWTRLLAMPAGERHYRSTWASYMLGRGWLAADAEAAVKAFQNTRTLVGAGFADPLGLAFSSLGWEANAELRLHHLDRALELYFTQYAVDRDSADVSLRLVAPRAASAPPEELERIAKSPLARRIMTAYLLSAWTAPWQSDSSRTRQGARALLAAMEAAGTTVAEAGRLATAAYHEGQFDLAERWCDRALADDPDANWIRAKLLARAGKIGEASALMAKVPEALHEERPASDVLGVALHPYNCVIRFQPEAAAQADLGAFRFAARDYEGALTALFRSGSWLDVAYVAEQVLGLDALRRRVVALRLHAEEPVDRPGPYNKGNARAERGSFESLAELLVRRELREGRFDWAIEDACGLSLTIGSSIEPFVAASKRAADPHASADDRATAHLDLARLLAWNGDSLVATEVEPDWRVFEIDRGYLKETGGDLPAGTWAFRDLRNGKLPNDFGWKLPNWGWWIEPALPNKWDRRPAAPVDAASPFRKPSDEERRRVLRHRPSPDEPLHWLREAYDHVLAAANLAPKNSETRADRLYQGAGALATADPDRARALLAEIARCCSTTATAKRATPESIGLDEPDPADD